MFPAFCLVIVKVSFYYGSKDKGMYKNGIIISEIIKQCFVETHTHKDR